MIVERRGLTIVETLIAIAVIGAVFVVLASIQVSNLGVTKAAREESELLQDAVTEFETLRTTVLQNFRAYFLGCPEDLADDEQEEIGECPISMVGATDRGYAYEIGRVWPASGSPPVGELVTAPPGFGPGVEPVDGVLHVTVTAVRDDRSITFSQLVSCLDATTSPTVGEPGICREPDPGGEPEGG